MKASWNRKAVQGLVIFALAFGGHSPTATASIPGQIWQELTERVFFCAIMFVVTVKDLGKSMDLPPQPDSFRSRQI